MIDRIVVLALLTFAAATAQDRANALGADLAHFDAQIEAATLRKDVAFFRTVLADDVRFTHGTGAIWDKEKWLETVSHSTFIARDLDSVEVEPHGDIIETTGHIHIKSGNPQNPEYQIWYVRVYARRNGAWQLLSNRTVRQVNGSIAQK